MKKLIKVTSILGAVVMGVSATGVGIANAASITDNTGDTTATVGLEQDKDAKITLTNAPNFDFGSEKIGSKAINLKAKTADDPITVLNPGLTTGWNVTVKNSDFMSDAETPVKLNGAVISLNGVVSTPDEGNTNGKPTTGLVKVNDQDQNIFTATAGNGIGTWLNTFTTGDDTAQLDIPSGNVAGNYKSNLTWTLTNAPGSEVK